MFTFLSTLNLGRCGASWGNPFFTINWPSFPEILWRLGALVFSSVAFLIGVVYQLFAAMAGARIFDVEVIEDFAQRIHVILGIVMVFVVLINFFRMVADPEKLISSSSSGKSVSNTGKGLLTKIITTLILLVSINYIFSFAFKLQEAVIDDNVIGKLFLGGYENQSQDGETANLNTEMRKGGNEVALSILRGFFFAREAERASEMVIGNQEYRNKLLVGHINSDDYIDRRVQGTPMTIDAFLAVVENNGFNELYRVDCDTIEKTISFTWPLATIAGLLVVWMLFVYSIDLGIRVVKLGFYQLIAPIPIAMRVVPGREKTFDNWLKETTSTFFDVFVRLVIIFFSVMAIRVVSKTTDLNFWANQTNQPQLMIAGFAYVLIILGIILFMKSAPKIISSVLGLGDGSGGDYGIGFGKVKSGYKTLESAAKSTKEAAAQARKPLSAARKQAQLARQASLQKTNNLGNRRNVAVRNAAALGTGFVGALMGAAKGVSGAMKGKSRQQILGEIAGAHDRKTRKMQAAGGRYSTYLAQSARDAMESIKSKRAEKRAQEKREYQNAEQIASRYRSKTVTADQEILGNMTSSINNIASKIAGNNNVRDSEKAVLSSSAALTAAINATRSTEGAFNLASGENATLKVKQGDLDVARVRAADLFQTNAAEKLAEKTELENDLRAKYGVPTFTPSDVDAKKGEVNREISKVQQNISDLQQQRDQETDPAMKQAYTDRIAEESQKLVDLRSDIGQLDKLQSITNEVEIQNKMAANIGDFVSATGTIDISKAQVEVDNQRSLLPTTATNKDEETQIKILGEFKKTLKAMETAKAENPSIVFNTNSIASEMSNLHDAISAQVASNDRVIANHNENQEKEKDAREKLAESINNTRQIQDVFVKSNEAEFTKNIESMVKNLQKIGTQELHNEIRTKGVDLSRDSAVLAKEIFENDLTTKFIQNPDGSVSKAASTLDMLVDIGEKFSKLKQFEPKKTEAKPDNKDGGKK